MRKGRVLRAERSGARAPGRTTGRQPVSGRGSVFSVEAGFDALLMTDYWKDGDIQLGLTAVRRELARGGEDRAGLLSLHAGL